MADLADDIHSGGNNNVIT